MEINSGENEKRTNLLHLFGKKKTSRFVVWKFLKFEGEKS